MQVLDSYAVLCVDRHASMEEIKRAYKKLAKRYHPDIDRSPYAVDKMCILNEAYKSITDGASELYSEVFCPACGCLFDKWRRPDRRYTEVLYCQCCEFHAERYAGE